MKSLNSALWLSALLPSFALAAQAPSIPLSKDIQERQCQFVINQKPDVKLNLSQHEGLIYDIEKAETKAEVIEQRKMIAQELEKLSSLKSDERLQILIEEMNQSTLQLANIAEQVLKQGESSSAYLNEGKAVWDRAWDQRLLIEAEELRQYIKGRNEWITPNIQGNSNYVVFTANEFRDRRAKMDFYFDNAALTNQVFDEGFAAYIALQSDPTNPALQLAYQEQVVQKLLRQQRQLWELENIYRQYQYPVKFPRDEFYGLSAEALLNKNKLVLETEIQKYLQLREQVTANAPAPVPVRIGSKKWFQQKFPRVFGAVKPEGELTNYQLLKSWGFDQSQTENQVAEIGKLIAKFMQTADKKEMISVLEESNLYHWRDVGKIIQDQLVGSEGLFKDAVDFAETGIKPDDRTIHAYFQSNGTGRVVYTAGYYDARGNSAYGLPSSIPSDEAIPLPSGKGFIRKTGSNGGSGSTYVAYYTVYKTVPSSQDDGLRPLLQKMLMSSMLYSQYGNVDTSILPKLRKMQGIEDFRDPEWDWTWKAFQQWSVDQGLSPWQRAGSSMKFILLPQKEAGVLRVKVRSSRIEELEEFLPGILKRSDLEIGAPQKVSLGDLEYSDRTKISIDDVSFVVEIRKKP